MLDVLDELDDVAAGLAAEAVEQPPGRGDVERRGLLVVERAEALEVAAAGVPQRDVLADDVVDRATSRGPARCPRPGSALPRSASLGAAGARPCGRFAVAAAGYLRGDVPDHRTGPRRADRRPLAGSYSVAVALALLGLSPFIVVSTAGQLIENDLIHDLHATMFGIELTNALANAGYAFGAVLAADLIQRLPARRLYLSCETAFVAGALLSAFAPGIVTFLIGRSVQGVATGMLLVAALPPLVTRFGAARLPGTAAVIDLGLFGMVTLGPLAGGLSAATGQWRTMFVILAGLAALGMLLGVLGFAGGEQTSRIGFDWSAIRVALISTVLPFLGIAWIAKDGFTSPGFLIPLCAGLLGLGTLLVRQFRKPKPSCR